MQWRAALRSHLSLGLMVLGLCFLGEAQAQSVMLFGDGKGEVTLPASYERVPGQDASLVVATKQGENVVLFFDLNSIDGSERSALAETFIREQAQKKNRKIRELPDRVVLLDSSDDSQIAGRQFANLHWQVGFGNTVVVMSARIARDAADATDVKQFLSSHVGEIIQSLRRVNP